jgi:hypothetical protein
MREEVSPMTRTATVVASSRYVRMAIATCAAATLPVVLALQLFSADLGQTSRQVVSASDCGGDGCAMSADVVRVVADLEGQGLTCRAKPALTDSIVFEWRDARVEVVDFAAALTALSRHEGWVRRYCLPQ